MNTMFYSQSLDNSSPDYMYSGNKPIPIDTDFPPGRQRIQFTNELARRKRKLSSIKYSTDITLYYSLTSKLYLIEMSSNEYDESNRRRTILFSGDLDDLTMTPGELTEDVKLYSNRIGWQVDSHNIDEILRIGAELRSKQLRKKKIIRGMVLITVVLLIALIICTKCSDDQVLNIL